MKQQAPQVISVSRRTDIPAFYSEWFMRRVAAGFACYRNPFGGKMHTVSLKPEDVTAFVFWSRNYAPLLPYLSELDTRGYRSYFHFTITGYGLPLERATPPAPETIDLFKSLANRYSPKHVLWRFDPLILANRLPADELVARFDRLACQLSGYTERCYISFVDYYQKTRRNLHKLTEQGWQFFDPPLKDQLALARTLLEIGRQYQIQLYACCESELLDIPGIHQARCVDPFLLRDLFPQHARDLKAAPTRTGCGCFASRDIGAYDTCGHGCLYCYANTSHAAAVQRLKAHEPGHSALILT